MSPADQKTKTTTRMIIASFAAGAAAMVMVGLVAPVAIKGGLSVRDAMAATVDHNTPMIQPINVSAVRAQLAAADRTMETTREATAASIARLDRLSGR